MSHPTLMPPWPTEPWPPDCYTAPPRLADLDLGPGEPVESGRHRRQQTLLEETLALYWRDRADVCVESNFFFFYNPKEMRTRDVRGPDLIAAVGVPRRERKAWATWEEDGRVPDVIVEILSPSTAANDRGDKKRIYELLHVPELFHFDPWTAATWGWRNSPDGFVALLPNAAGRFEVRGLGLELGPWEGTWIDLETTWLRWYTPDGALLPTEGEVAAVEAARAAAADARAADADARAADAERRVAELEARLAELTRRGGA